MSRRLFRWPVLIFTAFLLAVSTVAVSNWIGGSGFPLPWKTGGCPPPGIVLSSSCFLAIGFDWLRFAIDLMFYVSVEYVLILAFTKYRAGHVSTVHRI